MRKKVNVKRKSFIIFLLMCLFLSEMKIITLANEQSDFISEQVNSMIVEEDDSSDLIEEHAEILDNLKDPLQPTKDDQDPEVKENTEVEKTDSEIEWDDVEKKEESNNSSNHKEKSIKHAKDMEKQVEDDGETTNEEEAVHSVEPNETIRVIVELNESFTPEGQLSAKNRGSQKEKIKAAQDRVIETITQESPDSIMESTTFETIPYMALEIDAEGLELLSENENVKNITEDIIVYKNDVVNDIDVVFSPQLHQTNHVMNTNRPWSLGFTGQGKTIAILDTGVDKNHSFLANKVVSEACYSGTGHCPGGATELTTPGSAVDYDGHGTHVAGIAAGKGQQFSGVAKDSNIIAINVLANNGNGLFSDVVKGLERVYALRNQYDITAVNLSLGGGRYTSSCDQNFSSMKNMVDNLKSVGIATIAASGNESYKNAISAPACISSVISVGATNNSDQVTSFSNSATFLDLLAPGFQVYSAIPGGGFSLKSGTSMASPQVAGGITLVQQRYLDATVDELVTYMKQNGVNVVDSANGITKPRLNFTWIESSLPALDQVPKPTWNGDVIQWTGVSNAVQYELKLYKNSVVIDTRTVGASVRQFNYSSNMSDPGVYTVTVQAIANQVSYRNGRTSTPSDGNSKGVVYFENFESTEGGYTISGFNASWQWGTPTTGPNSAHSGTKVWGTNLSGSYRNHESSFITSPTINLSNVGSPITLSWMQYAVTERHFDYVNVDISKDGGQTWDRIYRKDGSISTEWEKQEFELDEAYAVPNFRVRFGIQTDSMVTFPGFYIDDVVITGLTIPALGQVQKPTWSGDVINWTGVANAAQYEVKLYRGSTVVDTQRVGGNVRQYNFGSRMSSPGFYTVTVQAIGDQLNYRNGVPSVPSNENRKGIVYFEDFESNNGQFTVSGSNSSWQWGVPTSGPQSAYSGTKVWATNLGAAYNNSESSFIVSPTINLSNSRLPITLSWMQFAVTERNFDYFNVEVSKDGGQTWERVYRADGVISESWEQQEVILNESHAVSNFRVRFGLQSDHSITELGLYIDDVMVTAGTILQDLGRVQRPTWNGDVIHWNGIANANQYELKLYRGTSLVATERVSASTHQYNFSSRMTSPGRYTVTVQALGNQTVYSDGEVSLPSEEKRKFSTLPTVQRPTWGGDVIHWNGVANASQYELKLYRGTSLVATQRVGATVRQHNFASQMANPGSYTVTVQAIGDQTNYLDGTVSSPSEENRKFVTLPVVPRPTWNGEVIHWSGVENASQYELKLYRGTSIVLTQRVGATVRQHNFASQMANPGSYTVTVQAIGDQTNYLNGAISVPSLENRKTVTLPVVQRPTWNGEVIHWNGVANASQYELKLYRGTSVAATQRVGGSVRHYNFASLMATPGVYTVTVQAIGDQTNYQNGGVSVPSVEYRKTVTLPAVQRPTWDGEVIHWNSVENAFQYELKLYREESIVETLRVSSTTVQHNFASQMEDPGRYTVTVQAIGDQTNYLDGSVSAPSLENQIIIELPVVAKPTWDGDVIRWNGVANASQYELKLYRGSTLVRTQRVGGSIRHYNFASRMANPGTYRVTVQALGNGTDYSNGPESVRSNQKVTLNVVQKPTWSGDVIRWNSVANASHYELKLYRGSTLVRTQRVRGTVSQYNFASRMETAGAYRVTVQAIGNNGTYRNGPVSTRSNQKVTLNKVQKPTWSGDVIRWNGVANASQYELKLYRGTTLVRTERVRGTVRQYNFASRMGTAGAYRVTVQAIGNNGTYRSGPVSTRSNQKVTLSRVQKPTWNGDVIRWNSVANASHYELKLYRGNTLVRTERVRGSVRQYNFSSRMKNRGSYTVTVQAIGNNGTYRNGAVSTKSNQRRK
ncbi:S8 family serine peptidase [Alkalihalobacterium chitinilyticum]|uniref:S8 family serine peptidase n=1 Tax=Alkalihalobacterium chitinilyticum TaxID=2980103 RepID=A0ABT5VEY2_9BACI|nr:S8 family serine peptidase [Alkalihalobacterium chitinilyticum]MDE5414021.1 S8 family serine peptidase [Alkalihalobacterium chitinilyticum]